jgi:hypothetical protein
VEFDAFSSTIANSVLFLQMQLLTSDFELAFHLNRLKLGATLLINSGMSSSHLEAVAFPESLEKPSGTQSYF